MSNASGTWDRDTHISHMTHINESCQTGERVTLKGIIVIAEVCHAYDLVFPRVQSQTMNLHDHVIEKEKYIFSATRVWESHWRDDSCDVMTHIIESYHTCEGVTLWLWVITATTESCHTREWVMSHIWMSHFTYMDESGQTYGWVMSHTWQSHVTNVIESLSSEEPIDVTALAWRQFTYICIYIWINVNVHMYILCTYVCIYIWVTLTWKLQWCHVFGVLPPYIYMYMCI